MSEPNAQIEHINALTRNARSTWFALLAALVFVTITLMGVEHIDFYGVDRATKLPLVDVEVPTRYFFFAAPLLTAAIYCYFHLYLIRLWDALAEAEPKPNGMHLSTQITPWLISDAALHLRDDGAAPKRPLETPARWLNFLLAWGAGLVVLGFLWWQGMTARNIWMTLIAAFSLLAAAASAWISWCALYRRLKHKRPSHALTESATFTFGVPALACALLFVMQHRVIVPTKELNRKLFETYSIIPLAPVDLTSENIVEKPDGWLPEDLAREEFRVTWCKRDWNDCADQEMPKAFKEEWKRRRSAAIDDLRKPDWSKINATRPDWRGAILNESFLSGANLAGAHLQNAVLSSAQLQNAYLDRAQLQNADLSWAQLQNAYLSWAQLQNAYLSWAQLQNAALFRAQLQNADLSRAQLQDANLSEAQLQDANLSRAQLQDANLRRAQLQGAVLHFAELTGKKSQINFLNATNLSASINNGGALRFVSLAGARFDAKTDFRNAFLDGSVARSAAFDEQMGTPCQWHADILADEQFYGRWRGWVEAKPARRVSDDWRFVGPAKWRDVTPIPPPEGCEWKTGPMPSAEAD
ncbi:pentapeptide repeat-containing protein [Planktotalea sp.]|uniref:pentapeptide repeat-containing protein n=1 Tax=Planktotalea sp. TaxID=2029877 RepID=UPI003D6B604D